MIYRPNMGILLMRLFFISICVGIIGLVLFSVLFPNSFTGPEIPNEPSVDEKRYFNYRFILDLFFYAALATVLVRLVFLVQHLSNIGRQKVAKTYAPIVIITFILFLLARPILKRVILD
jgi:hypothetical protein